VKADGTAQEFIDNSQVHLFRKVLERSLTWRIGEKYKVTGQEAIKSLNFLCKTRSVDSMRNESNFIKKLLPLEEKAISAEVTLKEEPTEFEDQYYIFRHLWLFRSLLGQEESDFKRILQIFNRWTEFLAANHYKVGVQDRQAFGESLSEEELGRRAMICRQAKFPSQSFKDILSEESGDLIASIKDEISSERERARVRLQQTLVEEEFRSTFR
jgi:hypothetical protein